MTANDDSSPMSSGSVYSLSTSQIGVLKKKAEMGDKDAAYRLVQYYMFSESDKNLEDYWMLRAAVLRHPVAQYNLAFNLFHQNPPDLKEALKWAEMASQNGSPKASNLMEKIIYAMRSKTAGEN